MPVVLNISRSEATSMLDARIDAGRELLEASREARSEPLYEQWKQDRSRWISFTSESLDVIYEESGPREEFDRAFFSFVYVAKPWHLHLEDDRLDIGNAVNVLASLQERLALAQEPSARDAPREAASSVDSDEGDPVIFLVHGRDHGRRDTVARFLDRTGGNQYEVVILDERASGGRTLIEKVEHYSKHAQYAVVLLTGDDVGALRAEKPDLKLRARQNVVMELGFFYGKLGRNKVAVLFDESIEKPSDVDGVGYISWASDWQTQLVTELQAVGLDFSLDRLTRQR